MVRLILVCTLLAIIFSYELVSGALTITLDNGKMVLSKNEKGEPLKTGDVIEKYITVRNVNEEKVSVEVSSSGDLGDYIEIMDKKFEMQPGEVKKIRFKIKIAKEGETESKINVKFYSPSEKKGVALSSVIVVIAEKNNFFDFFNFDNNEEKNSNEFSEKKSFGLVQILIFSMIGLLIILIFLFFVSKNLKKNRSKIDNEKDSYEKNEVLKNQIKSKKSVKRQ